MLKMIQSKVHKMKMDAKFRSNPVGATLKWPSCFSVTKEDIDVDVVTHVEHDAIVVPVNYLRSLFTRLHPDDRAHLNKMVDIISADQEKLKGTVRFTGPRGHYH